ncbi:NUDIX hydrolase domain-like protein [Radiomyces spectabilis]|uniref:NUDIX hydrolase domain-like protein n=1 Tax=Radiomyces spectabilis TaxID=64574 RepID=UPI00221FBF4C|nr:NUDIX hydrolase domain-like protein [Radiomyces spectabilis]KAI8371568.1 NUDIX hydrolase domain-like protein [Radiomyces spectabilis]
MLLPLVTVQTDSSPRVNLGQGQWLQLEKISYVDGQGNERWWERCIRKKASTASVDAVDIHAILLTPEPELLLVIQYRPAIGKYCIEFPSGLIDANEEPIISAQRELKEETGYHVPREQIQIHATPVCYEPGMTDSCCYVAYTTIDVSKASKPEPQREADEWTMQTLSLPLKGLWQKLQDLQASSVQPLLIDSRVYAFAAGQRAYQQHLVS